MKKSLFLILVLSCAPLGACGKGEVTQGNPDKVALVLVRPAVPPPTPASAPATAPAAQVPKLEETYWKLTSLAEGLLDPAKMNREAHLQFSSGGRVSGTGGCNRLIGSYRREGDKLSFGALAGTKMACPPETDLDGPLSEALTQTRSFKLEGKNLSLLNGKGKVVAEFQARD